MLNNSESTVLRAYDPLNMCHRSCERDYQKWYEGIDLALCKRACNNNKQYKAPEKSDDQPTQYDNSDEATIQYTNYDCHRICEERHDDNIWRAACKQGCNFTNQDNDYGGFGIPF